MIKRVSRPIVIMFGLLLFALPAFAGDVKLQWNYTDPIGEEVSKYTAKWGKVSGVYTNSQDFVAGAATTITETVVGLKPGIYFFVVTASSGTIESDPSNEVSTTVKPKRAETLVVIP